MAITILKAGPSFTTLLEDDVRAIHCIVSGSPESAEWRNGILAGLDYLKEHKLTKWIANVQDMGVVDTADTEWVEKVSVPDAIASGLRYMANIVPEDIFAQLAMNSWTQTDGFENRYFQSLEAAKQWLASV